MTISVNANVATDEAGNPNTAATSKTVSVDVDRPTVTIGIPSGTQTGAFDATITFSETVSGFTQSDVSLTGSAASITDWRANSDNTVYAATITPTANGTVTVSVDANVATDAANNPNTAATAQTVTIEIPPAIPDPATWMPDANLRSAVRSALGLATDAAFTQTQLQQLTELFASQSGISDITGLEHATELTKLSLWRNDISNLTPIQNLTSLTYLRLARNDISDVSPLSGLTALTSLGLQHNSIVNVAPLATLVNLTWLRLAGNSITDLSALVTLVNVTDSDVDLPDPDTTPPGVSISVPSRTQTGTYNTRVKFTSGVSITVPSDRIETGAFDVTITFTEPVSGFEQADLSVTGTATVSITGWETTDNTVYTVTITPTTSGEVTLNVPAGVATDTAGNPNTASTPQTITVDMDPPSVSITVPTDEQTGAFDATITFTEVVSDFEQADLSLSGTANAAITSWETTDNTTYTAEITPSISGTVALSVPAGVATDVANNPNITSGTQTVTVLVTQQQNANTDSPGVSITVLSGVQNGAFDVTITFTEPVSDFVQADLSLTSNTAGAAITTWTASDDGTTYSAEITPTSNGAVTFNVAQGVATDAENNLNTAATSKVVTVEATVVVFTDANLAVAVRAQLGLDANAPITSLAILNLTTLSAAFREINDLTGLEYAINLTELGLSVNDIRDITALSSLTKLQSLSLDFNDIRDITPLAGLVNLRFLKLASNPIKPSPPAAVANLQTTLPKLTFVDIRLPDPDSLIPDQGLARRVRAALGLAEDAELTETAMLGLTSLSDAGHGWDIYSLTGLEHATNLTVLRLNSYTISDISSLAGLVSLTKLDLGANDLDDNDINSLAGLVNLTELTLYGNEIGNISPLAGLANLTRLWLFKCNISNLSPLSNLTNLTELTLSDNPISDLSHLSGLTQLIHLTLHRCNISDINPLAGLVNLVSLQLYNNSISDVGPVANLVKLEDLELERNQIRDVTPIANLVKLIVLKLEGNPILDTSPLFPLTQLERPLGEPSVWLDIDVSQYPPWDVNEDSSVDNTDITLVNAALGQTGDAIVNPRTDVNSDGMVDAADTQLVMDNLDAEDANEAPPANVEVADLLDPAVLKTLDRAALEAQLDILRTESDGSPKYLQAIALIESILAAMRPDETQVLANYPNPFNPETWIPYQLATDSDVTITIYDKRGTVVRRLEFGHQRAGYYTRRSHAAHWDGRNGVGERVASGIYFYQLQADGVSSLRKMLILK